MPVDSIARGVLLLVCASAACGRPAPAPPAAAVSVTVSKKAVPQGGLLDYTYRFEVKPGATFNGDYRVFVHLKRDDGTAIWMDDHELPAAQQTSDWKPGQVIEYSRTRFLPAFSYLGPATLEVGLYRDAERLSLEVPGASERELAEKSYKVATIDVRPRSENIQIIRLSGWHRPEYAADDPTVEWQWTHKVATFSIRNPKADVTLFLDLDSREDAFGSQPQRVAVYAGDTKLGDVAATNTPTLHRLPVPAAALGAADMAEFRIEVDRTFIPSRLPKGEKDDRELGVRIFHAHIEGR